MNFCAECETCGWCRQNGCIPVQRAANYERVMKLPITFAGSEPMPTAEETLGLVGWLLVTVAALILGAVVTLPLWFLR